MRLFEEAMGGVFGPFLYIFFALCLALNLPAVWADNTNLIGFLLPFFASSATCLGIHLMSALLSYFSPFSPRIRQASRRTSTTS